MKELQVIGATERKKFLEYKEVINFLKFFDIEISPQQLSDLPVRFVDKNNYRIKIKYSLTDHERKGVVVYDHKALLTYYKQTKNLNLDRHLKKLKKMRKLINLIDKDELTPVEYAPLVLKMHGYISEFPKDFFYTHPSLGGIIVKYPNGSVFFKPSELLKWAKAFATPVFNKS